MVIELIILKRCLFYSIYFLKGCDDIQSIVYEFAKGKGCGVVLSK